MAVSGVSLSAAVFPIVRANCAVIGCHDAITKSHGQDLSTASSIYAAWIDKSGFNHCLPLQTPIRVTPGEPSSARSYVMLKIRNMGDLCPPSSSRMPLPPRAALTPAQVATIEAWIQQGAKNN